MNSLIHLFKELYAYCTDFVINLANITGLSYYEVNFVIFIIVYPLLLFVSPIVYFYQKSRLRTIKKKITSTARTNNINYNYIQMAIVTFVKWYFEKWWRPSIFLIVTFGFFVISLYIELPELKTITIIVFAIVYLSILISIINHFLKRRWSHAVISILFYWLITTVLAMSFAFYYMIYGIDPLSDETIKYKGESYQLFEEKVLRFGNDSIQIDTWYKTLNVDGDNKRVMRILNPKNISLFSLPNSVNNNTETTYYYMTVRNHKYLWIEDNFGTTVIDIDLMKKIKVNKPMKELSEIGPSGAPFGVKRPISRNLIKKQLNLKIKDKVILLDSLTHYE